MTKTIDSSQDIGQTKPCKDNRDYRITYLNLVLCELGHPLEPDHTLLEVLERVEDKSEAFIITVDDMEISMFG